MKKILIQANKLDKVIDVFMYAYLHQGCKKQDIADQEGFSLRQADYYTNACVYLDLLNRDLSPTTLAKDIFENSPAEITERVYQRIIEDELMGKVYKRIVENPNDNNLNFAINLVKTYYPGYSDAVYNRRSDNIVKWCKIIVKYLNIK